MCPAINSARVGRKPLDFGYFLLPTNARLKDLREKPLT